MRKKCRGFTIVELLVVIFITGVLVTLVIADFRKGKKRDDLNLGARTLAESLNKIHNLAMTGKIEGDVPNQTPTGGYGLYFDFSDLDHYLIFGDGGDNPNHFYESTIDDFLIEEEQINLPVGVAIESVCYGDPETCYSGELSIVYYPLQRQPYVTVDNTCTDPCLELGTGTVFHLQHQDINNMQIDVILNGLTGQVEVINNSN